MTLGKLLGFFLLINFTLGAEVPRLDCLLNEKTINKETCEKRECHWAPVSEQSRLPACYLDVSKVGFDLSGTPVKRANGLDADLLIKPTAHKSLPFPSIEKLKLQVDHLSENILRVRLTDPAHNRYEVPVQFSEFTIPNTNPSSTKYEVTLNGSSHLIITRKGTETKILDTSPGGLIYSDKFIQFVTNIATSNVYGIGENYQLTLKHSMAYETYPLFARDRPLGEHESNHYGVHPFYTVLESDGRAHGVLLLNSNAMAFTMLPTPAVAIKTTGGIVDLLIFVGNNPEHVVQLYTSVIGRPVMPPFWSLGFQLCRYGYKNLDQVKQVLKRNLDKDVPVDVQYLDIDYMDEHRDFTYDQVAFKDLPEYIRETKANNSIKWTLILDPAIEGDKPGYHAFDEGYKKDVFIKWPDSIPPSQRSKPGNAPTDKGVMYGHVWPKGPSAFPDFFKNATKEWWMSMLVDFHKTLEFDSIWIDMNEPSNFDSEFLQCPLNEYEMALPSQHLDPFNTSTLCMSAVQGEKAEYRHYDVHSLFGWSQTKPTYLGMQAATGKRGFVVSRSTYPSSGKYAAHWLGDNYSSWEQMRQSIIGMLQFSLFGISFTGTDICGFMGFTPYPELCRRWLQLGAYYPFSRSHNNDESFAHDPGFFTEIGSPEVTKAAVGALQTRYQLLHYFYTIFYRAHVYGETVARPLHHEFPQDVASRTIDQQFFLGAAILVNPFLFENQTVVNAYIPAGTEWYKLSGQFVEKAAIISGHIQIPDADSNRPILLRAGAIIPVIGEKSLPKPLNTNALRRTPIELWIMPNHTSGEARGDLFFDDGESIDTIERGEYNFYQFKFEKCHLTLDVMQAGYKKMADSKDVLTVSSIKVTLPKDATDFFITQDGRELKYSVIGSTLTIDTAIDLLQTNSKKPIAILLQDKSGKCIFN